MIVQKRVFFMINPERNPNLLFFGIIVIVQTSLSNLKTP